MAARAIIVASATSASGKTTVTAGLIGAFRNRGLRVSAAKAGPDYIDAAFHTAAAGRDCINLDSWAMDGVLLDALLAGAARDADLVLIEAAMGLFDGLPGSGRRRGSAADLAVHFRLPVILVIDVGGLAQTAAAVVQGLANYDRDVRVAGVILNRVASERHRGFIAEAIAATGIPVLGAIPRDAAFSFPSRHLGLVQAGEHTDLGARVERLAGLVAANADLDAVLAAADPIPAGEATPMTALDPPGNRIALARDAAFTFMYPHILEGWRRAGAAVVPFSPLADEPPPHDCDFCWLPGGYPELHAGPLAAAGRFRDGLRRFAGTRRVHGECGGFMVLGEWLEDGDGKRHAMTGLLGHATSFAKRKLTLGYREAQLTGDAAIGRANTTIRGHEFHYATVAASGNDTPVVTLRDGQGRDLGPAGGRRGNVSGTFFHAIAQVAP